MSTEALANTLLHLVNIESVSGDEAELTDWFAHEMAAAGLPAARRARDWAVFKPERSGKPVVLLAGHSDTVPAQGNLPGHLEGEWVRGLGASDMKAGLAVMLELARSLTRDAGQLTLEPWFLLFGQEEMALDASLLPQVFAACPFLSEVGLVLMMEPTANTIQAGCLGNIIARLEFEGVAAHSARPWLGKNAIHEAVRGLQALAGAEIRDAQVGGLTFREVVSVTTIQGGVANNVVPDHVVAGVNFRYAPDRTPAEAEVRLRELAGADGRLTIVSNAPPAPVAIANPLLERLRATGGMELEPKQAWTPVAEFAQAGYDAVNYGPGDPAMAHRRDERVAVSALAESLDVLRRFLKA
jgi:succinyl-diaminopimelate desuccinylase